MPDSATFGGRWSSKPLSFSVDQVVLFSADPEAIDEQLKLELERLADTYATERRIRLA